MASDRNPPTERFKSVQNRTPEQMAAEIASDYELEQKKKKMQEEIASDYELTQKQKQESAPAPIQAPAVDLTQLGKRRLTAEEWNDLQRNLQDSEDAKIEEHSLQEKEHLDTQFFTSGKIGNLGVKNRTVYTPEKRKEILKSIFRSENASVTEAILSPLIEGGYNAFEKGGATDIPTGVVSGIRKLVTDDFFNAPLTLDEIRQRVKVNDDGTVDVDMADLVRTHLKDSDKLIDYAETFLTNIGKLDAVNVKAMRDLMSIKGSLIESDPEAKAGKKRVELADAFLGNIPSAIIYMKQLRESPLLQRPEGFNVIDPSQLQQVKIRIDEANKSNRPVKWKTQLFGTVEIPPGANEDTVNDLAFANMVIKNVDAITNYARSGKVQDVGMLINAALTNRLVSWGLAGAAKVAPKAAQMAAKLPWFAKVGTRAAGEASAGFAQSYIAGTSTQEENAKNAVINAVVSGSFSIAGSFADNLFNRSDRLSRAIVSDVVKDEGKINIITKAKTHADLPPEIKAEIPKKLFSEVKEMTHGYATSIRLLDENTKAYLETKDVAPDAHQFLNDIIADTDNPQAAKIRENLSMGYLFKNQKTVEAARVEMALRSVLGSGEQVRATETGPLNPPPVKDPIKVAFFKRAMDYSDSPERMLKFLEASPGGKQYLRPFIETINSPEYQARNFYAHSFQNDLNRSLNTHLSTLPANAEAFKASPSFERAMADRFREPGQVNMAGEFKEKASVDAKVKMEKKVLNKLNLNKNNVLLEIGKDIRRVVSEKGMTDKKSANILLDAVEDMSEGKQIPKEYAKKIIEAFQKLGGEPKLLANALKQIDVLDFSMNAQARTISELMRKSNALNKQDALKYSPEFAYVQRVGKKIEVKKNARVEAEKLSNSLASVSANKKELLETVRDFAFLGKASKNSLVNDFINKASDGIQNRMPVGQLELEIKGALQNPEVSKTMSPSERKGLRRLNAALSVFDRDMNHYKRAMEVSDLPDENLISKISIIRHAIDEVTNPSMIKELDAKIQDMRSDFDSFVTDRRMDLTPVESQHVWDYITGDAYTKLKLGSTQFIDLDATTIDSMFKFYDEVGRSTLDEVAKIHFEVFDKPLDRAAFHAFYMTPSNNFDSDFVVRGALRKEANAKFEAIKSEDPYKIGAFVNAIRPGEAIQAHAAHKTKLSTGAYMNYFNDDVRMAKRIYRDVMNGLDEEGFGEVHFQKMIEDSPEYQFIENPTLVGMIKKAFVAEGYRANMNIYNFLEDGTVELTDLGKFLNKIYSDKKMMEGFYRAVSEDPANISNVREALRSKLEKEFTHKIPEKMVEEAIPDYIEAKNKFYAKYITDYWNFFDRADASPMFKNLMHHLELRGKIEAEVQKITGKMYDSQNKIYAFFDGNNVPKIAWRKHRNRNTVNTRRGGLFDGTVDVLYEDLRNNPLYGTSEYGIAGSAAEYKLDAVRNPLDNLQHMIKTRIMSAGTQHSRAGLSSFTGLANVLGYSDVANNIAKYAGLVPDAYLPVEDAMPFMNVLNRAVAKDPGFLKRLSLGTYEIMQRYIVPFNVLWKPSAILKNNMQAAAAGLIKSDVTAKKVFNLGVGLISPIGNLFIRNEKGMPYGIYKLLLNTDSEVHKISMEVLDRGRDVVNLQGQMTKARYMQEGVVRKAPITDKAVSFGDRINNFFSEQIKERVEMYQRATAIDNGVAKHTRLVDAIQSGDVNTAHAMLEGMFPNRAKADIQWQLDNYLKAQKSGDINQALRGMLPMYVDQNIGMFGKTALSPMLKVTSRVIPGAGLFYNAKNMVYWHFMQLASAAGTSKGEKFKMAGVLAESALRTGAISLGLTAMGAGVSYPLYEALFSKQVRGEAEREEADFSFNTMMARIAHYGAFPQVDFSKVLGIETDPTKWGEYFSNYKNVVDFMSQIILGTNRAYPVFGYSVEKLWPAITQTWKALNTYNMAPLVNADDPVQAIKENIKSEEELEELFKVYKLDRNNPAHYDKLIRKVNYQQTYIWPQILDGLFKVSHLGFMTDILENPFSNYVLYSRIKELKNGVMVENERAKQAELDKSYNVGLDVPGQIKKQYMLPSDLMEYEFYKEIGFIDMLGDDDSFPVFMAKYTNIFYEAGFIDKTYAEKIRKSHIENLDWLTGETERKQLLKKHGKGGLIPLSDERSMFEGMQKK